MPLNTLRLNHQPSSHPNERIVFIKPIPRPAAQKNDYNRAEMVLKAIAAQCLPIMKDHYLSVTTLEEYEPNPEFIGRNFNNGEIIQLVIKSKSGAWLPSNMIQMVMMHELAHNTHMNHGKGFWQTRNLYAGEMRGLWSKGYTGEGLWGQGRSLQNLDEELGGTVLRSDELSDLPLCGGTFRSRQKKRKAEGPDLTWKEKRDKRIERKFGKNGEKLGEDEDARLTLEINRKGPVGGKPRVAQSKRGRELRAAAALARFETNKKEVQDLEINVKKDEEETETESEYEELNASQEDAQDSLGRKILDKKGQGMIRVCGGDEDEDDLDVKREMQELVTLNSVPLSEGRGKQSTASLNSQETTSTDLTAQKQDQSSYQPPENVQSLETRMRETMGPSRTPPARSETDIQKAAHVADPTVPGQSAHLEPSDPQSDVLCPICSMANDSLRLNCVACAHVLDVKKDIHHWKCKSEICKDSTYINAGDCGICGVCGARKLALAVQQPIQPGRDAGTSSYSAHITYV